MKIHIFQILKAAFAAVIIALLFALVFTLIIQLFSLSSASIKPVNQVLKILSVIAGGLLFLRGERGLIKGAAYGFIAVIATYLLFGAIAGSLSISWKFAIEIVLGVVAGAVTGIIAVNIKKNG